MRTNAVVLVTLVLAACGDKKPQPQASEAPKPETSAEPADKPAEPADKPAEPADKPAEPADKPAEPAGAMTPAELRAKYDELRALALGDTDAIASWYADDAFVGVADGTMPRKGGVGAVEFYKALKGVYPDITVAPQLVIVGERRVVAVLLAKGTQTGELAPGKPATGKPIGVLGAQYVVWGEDGRIVSDTHYVNQADVFGQLGMLPPGMPFRPVVEAGVAEPVVALMTGSQAEKDAVELHLKAQAALNAKDMKTMTELDATVADDITVRINTLPADIAGKEAYGATFQAWLGAHPDLQSGGDDIWAAGDYCVHASTMSATNSGELVMGETKMPATNKPWKLAALEIQRFEGGKEKEAWIFMNGMAQVRQLGLVPEAGGAAEPPKEAPPEPE